jgi:hypothetical protein
MQRCPHGNGPPELCSQCHGSVPTIVKVEDGNVFVDGKYSKTAAEHIAAAEEVMHRLPAMRRGGLAPRTCSLCRQPGHNAKTCKRGR